MSGLFLEFDQIGVGPNPAELLKFAPLVSAVIWLHAERRFQNFICGFVYAQRLGLVHNANGIVSTHKFGRAYRAHIASVQWRLYNDRVGRIACELRASILNQ